MALLTTAGCCGKVSQPVQWNLLLGEHIWSSRRPIMRDPIKAVTAWLERVKLPFRAHLHYRGEGSAGDALQGGD